MPHGCHSVADLFKDYAAHKARDEWHGEWGAALLYRPIAILAAAPLLRLGVPASAITLAGLLAALSLPVQALILGPGGYVAVGLTALLVAILDCLDGTIARASATVSRSGHYLDFVTDIVFRAAHYAAIGILAQGLPPAWLPVLPLAILAALLAIAARLCRVYGERFRPEAYDHDHAAPRGPSALLFSVISGLDPLLPLAVLALGALGGLGWLVVWLLAYSALDFLYTQYAVLRGMR